MPCSNRKNSRSGKEKGQVALEFLVMFGALLILFVIAILLYSNNVAAGSKMNDRLAALKLCMEVSSKLSSAESMGDGTTYALDLPPYLNYRGYEVWVKSDERLVVVDYVTDGAREAGASCNLHASGIANSTEGTFFRIAEQSNITNNGGGIHVEP